MNNGIVSSKIYNKRDDFYFKIVNCPHLDGDVPRATSYGFFSLRISVIAIMLLLKSSSNKDTGMTNFVKLSLNSNIEISLSFASINVI